MPSDGTIVDLSRCRRPPEIRSESALPNLVQSPVAPSNAPGIFGLIGAEPEPPPAPPAPPVYQDILDEQAEADRLSRIMMQDVLARKRQQLANEAYSRDPHTSMAAARKLNRLGDALAQLDQLER